MSDETLERYDVNKIITVINEKFANLPQTLLGSNLSQLRTLLISIFPSGLRLGANGYSHTEINPLFQVMLEAQGDSVTIGGEAGIRTLEARKGLTR